MMKQIVIGVLSAAATASTVLAQDLIPVIQWDYRVTIEQPGVEILHQEGTVYLTDDFSWRHDVTDHSRDGERTSEIRLSREDLPGMHRERMTLNHDMRVAQRGPPQLSWVPPSKIVTARQFTMPRRPAADRARSVEAMEEERWSLGTRELMLLQLDGRASRTSSPDWPGILREEWLVMDMHTAPVVEYTIRMLRAPDSTVGETVTRQRVIDMQRVSVPAEMFTIPPEYKVQDMEEYAIPIPPR